MNKRTASTMLVHLDTEHILVYQCMCIHPFLLIQTTAQAKLASTTQA